MIGPEGWLEDIEHLTTLMELLYGREQTSELRRGIDLLNTVEIEDVDRPVVITPPPEGGGFLGDAQASASRYRPLARSGPADPAGPGVVAGCLTAGPNASVDPRLRLLPEGTG